MARIVLVHGWNVSDAGANTVDRFGPFLEAYGHEVEKDEADYGYLTWQMFSWVARKAMRPYIVRRLAKAFENADVIVTHSNGANFAHRALESMEPRDRPRLLVHFSPALNRKTRRPPAASKMFVFYTRSDWAVRVATWLPFHPWGRMGAHGPLLGDPGTQGIDESGTVKGHSEWFRPPVRAQRYADVIHHIIREELP